MQEKKRLSTKQQQYPSTIQQYECYSVLVYTYATFLFDTDKNL